MLHGRLNIKHFFTLTMRFDLKQISLPYDTNSLISDTLS